MKGTLFGSYLERPQIKDEIDSALPAADVAHPEPLIARPQANVDRNAMRRKIAERWRVTLDYLAKH